MAAISHCGQQRTGSKHLTSLSRMLNIAQCCHYQCSVAAVLENVVFCSERLLQFTVIRYVSGYCISCAEEIQLTATDGNETTRYIHVLDSGQLDN